ncbi:hypothetical protein OCD81_20915 [Bacillus paranthracis]|uniref:hypothetical protein n=1 Tax=Bacillus paranthracis TaxID=2026186 RepID=UPI0021D2E666|nr:hypothetical protein [Bacillus paranthracis]MCU4953143.1 hypothetical protein [Bacillus paranthracis]
MVTQENYKEVYGDMEIKRIDRECYVTLKKYEGILHKCKVGFLFVFILFFIFCFSYKEVQVGPHSFEEVFSWKLIIGALVARIIFSYVSRYLIYIMVESVYKNRIKENQVKKNSDSFTILGVIKASIILILSPDLSAAKFFKNKFHEFVKNNKDKLHEHSNFEGEDLLLKAEGQDSVQGKRPPFESRRARFSSRKRPPFESRRARFSSRKRPPFESRRARFSSRRRPLFESRRARFSSRRRPPFESRIKRLMQNKEY